MYVFPLRDLRPKKKWLACYNKKESGIKLLRRIMKRGRRGSRKRRLLQSRLLVRDDAHRSSCLSRLLCASRLVDLQRGRRRRRERRIVIGMNARRLGLCSASIEPPSLSKSRGPLQPCSWSLFRAYLIGSESGNTATRPVSEGAPLHHFRLISLALFKSLFFSLVFTDPSSAGMLDQRRASLASFCFSVCFVRLIT